MAFQKVLGLKVLVTDRLGAAATQRFWINRSSQVAEIEFNEGVLSLNAPGMGNLILAVPGS